MSTLLAELVRKQVATGLIGLFSKTIDRVVEDMAHDLLHFDQEFRAELQQLVRAALQQALKDLNEPAPPEELPSHRREQLDRIETLLREKKQP